MTNTSDITFQSYSLSITIDDDDDDGDDKDKDKKRQRDRCKQGQKAYEFVQSAVGWAYLCKAHRTAID